MIHSNDWHLLEKEKVADALETDLYKGLAESEVRRRRRTVGKNDIWYITRVSPLKAAASAVFDLATLLLIISAAAAALFEKSVEAGALILLLVIGGAIRTAAHLYACRILEDRAKDKIPTVSVIRDGRIRLISAEEAVPGDIVILESGDTVPCDGRVVSGEDSVVSERGITDNKNPVHKFDNVIETDAAEEVPCEFRSNMLFAGSLVLSGTVRMAATACGEASLICRKQGGIGIDSSVKMPAVSKLGTRSRNTSLVMLTCVMIITALSIFFGNGLSLPDVFLGTMAMAVAAMSEFLTVIATITIAVGVHDAAKGKKNRVLIKQPEKLEELCGIGRIVFCGSSFFKSGRSEFYAAHMKGEYLRTDDMTEEQLDEAAEMISLALTASADSNRGLASGNFEELNNTDMDAVIRRAHDSVVKKQKKDSTYSFLIYDHLDADEEQTAGMQLSLIDYKGDVYAVGVGKAADVLACCTYAESADGEVPLTPEMRKEIVERCVRLEFSGASLLAVAVRKSPYMQLNRAAVLTQFMTFRGFFAVAEEPEENAKNNIAYLKERGIVPIVFTENPEADLYYCRRLGLFTKNTLRVKSGELTEEAVDSIGADGAVISFAEEGKNRLASAYAKAMKTVMHNRASDTDKILQDADEAAPITAAVGRETRDSGVTAAADIGIAAARSNLRTIPTTLSANSSVIIHSERKKSAQSGFGGFDSVVRAVDSASVMFANMESAKAYLTASQCARLIVLTAAVFLGIPFLSAVFLLIWGLLFDFAAILMTAFTSPENRIGGDFRTADGKRRIGQVVSGAVWGVSVSGWCVLLPFVMRILGLGFGNGEITAILEASVILCGALYAFTSLKNTYSDAKLRIPMAGVMFFGGTAVLVLILTLADIPVIGAAFCGFGSLLALVPTLVPFGIFAVERLARRVKRS